MPDTHPSILGALAALREGDIDAALRACDVAATSEPLAASLAAHLRREGDVDVYADGRAFRAFVDSGANRVLYAGTIDALAALHAERRPATVVDLGAGDGRVAVPLAAARPGVAWTLVDRSADQLGEAQAALAAAGVPATVVEADLLAFARGLADASVDGVQGTFAVHNLDADGRRALFAELRRAARWVAVVEFDVPDSASDPDAWLAFLADRYRVALREHAAEPLVVEGFLMPVLVGQLAPGRPRVTWEQPIDAWMQELRAAGFTRVERRPAAPFWWAQAWLVVAD
jgi:SAM-dependent methyltransferase